MGAAQFSNFATGETPEKAFWDAVSSATQESGHGGYSGTIAEKHAFRLFTPPPGVAALDFARWVRKSEPSGDGLSKEVPAQYARSVIQAAEVSDDKYGPAAAVEIKGEELTALRAKFPSRFPVGARVFFFFGWASS